jgi:poly(A) polymerase
VNDALLDVLRLATIGTPYEGRLYLVGGFVRDRLLDRGERSDDIDLVLEGDAAAVADWLYTGRIATHKPVTYPHFGTAMVHVPIPGDPDGRAAQIELVTARSETYRQGSRQPIVVPGTLQTDATRRDFTVNTFLQNLHTGEILDPLGHGYADLDARILRTPLDPTTTFIDDPLRMLRACRFAAKLGFTVEAQTYAALTTNAFRLAPEYGISFERIRDELNKTLLAPDAAIGLEMMRATGLLARFAPELAGMAGVTQNRWHAYDVWEHTLHALANLPDDAALTTRLAVLLHDVGKPPTRTVGDDGEAHFYDHEKVGAEIARTVLRRLRYSVDEIEHVCALVALHMRYGAYDPDIWTDAAVRRLIRAVGPFRRTLLTIARADSAACGVPGPTTDFDGLSERMEQLETALRITEADSPLSGQELMALLRLPAGPQIGRIKGVLVDAVVAGELAPDDKEEAERLARRLLDPNH